ncbi:hypothetical protein H4R35_007121 [Dimargaris xerosporica]|nr:hypothetical protein H4R35_007121 [Dimargaris xerosporica]
MVRARLVLTYGTAVWMASALVTARPEAPVLLDKQQQQPSPIPDPGKPPAGEPVLAPQLAPKPAPEHQGADALSECVKPEQFDPKADYFPHKLRLSSKEGYEVDYYKHFKVVVNKLEEETYVLVQCGTPEPQFGDNFMPELAGVTKFFEIPPKRYATLQNSTIAFLEELEVGPPVIIPGSSSAPYLDGRDMENKPNKALNKYVGINYSLTPRQYEEVDLVFAGNPNPMEKYVTPSEGSELTPLAVSWWPFNRGRQCMRLRSRM